MIGDSGVEADVKRPTWIPPILPWALGGSICGLLVGLMMNPACIPIEASSSYACGQEDGRWINVGIAVLLGLVVGLVAAYLHRSRPSLQIPLEAVGVLILAVTVVLFLTSVTADWPSRNCADICSSGAT